VPVVVSGRDEVLELERDIRIGDGDRDDGLRGDQLEPDRQAIAFTGKPISLENRALVRMCELDLVVERALLSCREQSNVLAGLQQFFAGFEKSQAAYDAILTDDKPSEFVFKAKFTAHKWIPPFNYNVACCYGSF